MTVLGERGARSWLRVLTVADVIVAVLAWVFTVGLMHSFWPNDTDTHSWGEYARVTLMVLGGGLAAVAVLNLAARWLIGRGLHLIGVLVAALPFEALLWQFISTAKL